MKLTKIKTGMTFKYETNQRTQVLKDLRRHVLQYGEADREVIAGFVRGHGFGAYKGGRHVAVLDGNIRLAIITAKTHADFN